MDWITTSGRTLDEAKSHALDQLGIVADEAEFDVVNDVEKGLFGRVKTEAKIRARVRPKPTVAKDDRGRRRSGGGKGGNRNQKGAGKGGNKGRKGESNRSGGNKNKTSDGGGNTKTDGGEQNVSSNAGQRNNSGGGRGGNNGRRDGGPGGNGQNSGAKNAPKPNRQKQEKQARNDKPKKETVEETMDRQEQEDAAKGFLEGVLGAFEMTGAVAVVDEPADDGAIEMVVTGEELGLLVGQKGVTLNALQELTRTVVQRQADGAKTDRLRVDVAGYRARRTAALQAFALKIADEVVDSGAEKLLEPMGPADRKVVHDALTDVEGVETGSEGEEPRRRVVIRPT